MKERRIQRLLSLWIIAMLVSLTAFADNEPPKFIEGDVLQVVGVTPVRDQIASLNLGEFSPVLPLQEDYSQRYELKIRRPKGAQANYPVTIRVKECDPLSNNDPCRLQIVNVDGVERITREWEESIWWDAGGYWSEDYLWYPSDWAKLTFQPGETEKTLVLELRLAKANYDDFGYNTYREYYRQFLAFSMPERTSIDYDLVSLTVHNPNYTYYEQPADDVSHDFNHFTSIQNNAGRYHVTALQDYEDWHSYRSFEVKPETKFIYTHQTKNHEAGPVTDDDLRALTTSIDTISPIEAVGTRTTHLTFITKIQEEDLLFDSFNDGNMYLRSSIHAEGIQPYGINTPPVKSDEYDIDCEMGFGEYKYTQPALPRLGALTSSKSTYQQGGRVNLTAELLNPNVISKSRLNQTWLAGMDITLDGGKTTLGIIPLYDESTHMITFSFLAPEADASMNYLAEVVLKEEMKPWSFEGAVGAKKREARAKSPSYDTGAGDICYLLPDAHCSFNVTNTKAPIVYTQNIEIQGIPEVKTFINCESYALRAVSTPADCSFGGKWTSSNDDVASITENGMLQINWEAGTAELTYTSDEVAYRKEHGLPANDDALIKRLTVKRISWEDQPELKCEWGATFNCAETVPYFCFFFDKKGWQIDGNGEAKVTVKFLYTDEYKPLVFYVTPSDNLIKGNIPFNKETFPRLYDCGPYEVTVNVPFVNAEGVKLNAVATQNIYLNKKRDIEITGLETREVLFKDGVNSIDVNCEIHYFFKNEPIYINAIGKFSFSGNYTYSAPNATPIKVGDWLDIIQDPDDDDYLIAKIHYTESGLGDNGAGRVEVSVWADESETGFLNTKAYHEIGYYPFYRPNIETTDFGQLKTKNEINSLSTWQDSNMRFYEQIPKIFEEHPGEFNYYEIAALIEKAQNDAHRELQLATPKIWGPCRVYYDDVFMATDSIEYANELLGVNFSYDVPQDNKKHTFRLEFPKCGVSKEFSYTNYSLPDEINRFYNFRFWFNGQPITNVDAIKAYYVVERKVTKTEGSSSDLDAQTVVMDTLSVSLPLTQALNSDFMMDTQIECKDEIKEIWFTDGRDEGLFFSRSKVPERAITERNEYGYPEINTNPIYLTNTLYYQLTLLDEETGEPITNASVRYYLKPMWSFRDYETNHKGFMTNDGGSVYSLNTEFDHSFESELVVEALCDGYVPSIIYRNNGFDREANHMYIKAESTDDHLHQTVVMHRVNNTSEIPYIKLCSDKDTINYPQVFEFPQLNSIIRYNEEDEPYLEVYLPYDVDDVSELPRYNYFTREVQIRLESDDPVIQNTSGTDAALNHGYYSYNPYNKLTYLHSKQSGFVHSYYPFRFPLKHFLTGQKRDGDAPVQKAKVWIHDLKNERYFDLPLFVNTAIDPREFLSDVELEIPASEANFKENATGKDVDTGFMNDGLNDCNIPFPSFMPIDFNLIREGNYIKVLGTYSQSFLPDGGLSEKLGNFTKLEKLSEIEDYFSGIKDAVNTGSQLGHKRKYLALPKAFAGIRAYVEARANINPLNNRLDFGISEMGLKAEASGYVQAGFTSPFGSLGFSLEGEMSATLNLATANYNTLKQCGYDEALWNNYMYDINVISNLGIQASVWGDVGLDLWIVAAKVGFFGTAGVQFNHMLKFRPYARNGVSPVIQGGKFSVNADLYAYAYARFLWYKWEKRWDIFNAEKTYYFPNNKAKNPYLMEDSESSVKTRTMLRASNYRPYKRNRLPQDLKKNCLLTKVDAQAMPFYLNGGKSLAYLNINNANDANDDKVQILTDGNKLTLDDSSKAQNGNFALHANSAGTASIVGYERSTQTLDTETAEDNEQMTMNDMANTSEVVVAINKGGAWSNTVVSEEDEDGKLGAFTPKTAINANGVAVATWTQGQPTFNEAGDYSGIVGSVMMRTIDADGQKGEAKMLRRTNDMNRVIDYLPAINAAGHSVVFCSEQICNEGDTISYLTVINDNGETHRIRKEITNLNIVAMTDGTFLGSGLTTVSGGSKDVEFFRIEEDGNVSSLGILGLKGHTPIDTRLVAPQSADEYDGLGLLWTEGQSEEEESEDEETTETKATYFTALYGARIGYESGKFYPSCPQPLVTLTDKNDKLSYFDGYMNADGGLTAAVTLADMETDGAVVVEKTINFTNTVSIPDAKVEKIINNGQSPISVSVTNEGYRPIDYVTVLVNNYETTVPVYIMPGQSSSITAFASPNDDMSSNLGLDVRPNFTTSVSYARSEQGIEAARRRAKAKTSAAASASLNVAATDMAVYLVSSSTNDDNSSNIIVEVGNRSKVSLKPDYKITVGVYTEAKGGVAVEGIEEQVISGSELYSAGTNRSKLLVFHVPALQQANNVYVVAKTTDKDGNPIKDLREYDNQIPVTVFASVSGSGIDYKLPGDANNDGEVNATDINATVNYILEQPNPSFSFSNADVNKNEKITVADVNGIVDIILNNNDTRKAQSRHAVVKSRTARRAPSLRQSNVDMLYSEDATIAPGDSVELCINLYNQQAYSSMQFDVVLPEGIKVAEKAGNYAIDLNEERAQKHQVVASDRRDGSFRVLAFSTDNKEFDFNDGLMLTLTLVADREMKLEDGVVTLRNKILSTQDEKTVRLPETTSLLNMMHSTDLKQVEKGLDQKKWYKVNGMKVRRGEKGIKVAQGAKVFEN